MTDELIKLSDLIISNALVVWLALRIVTKVDVLDSKLDNHETRIAVAEQELSYAKKINR